MAHIGVDLHSNSFTSCRLDLETLATYQLVRLIYPVSAKPFWRMMKSPWKRPVTVPGSASR